MTFCVCESSLDRELSNLKRKRTTLMASLRSPGVEVVRSVRAGEWNITPLAKNFSRNHLVSTHSGTLVDTGD